MRRFVSIGAAWPTEVQAMLKAGHSSQAALAAHSLISTSAILGAQPLSAIARSLQSAIEANDRDRIAVLIEAITQEHERVVVALRTYLAAQTDPVATPAQQPLPT